MAYKIGVIGNKDSVMPFKMLGFDVYYTASPLEARQLVDQLAQKNYGIIYLTDSLLSEMNETVEEYKAAIRPALISIPTHEGSNGYGKRQINDYVEKAVGQNIL